MSLPEYLDAPAAGANRATMRVVEAVAGYFYVEPERVFSRERLKSVALARQVSMYVLRMYQHPRPSYPEVGREFNRDHTTAMHSIAQVDRRIEDKEVQGAIEMGRLALDATTMDQEITRLERLRHKQELLVELRQVEDQLKEVGAALDLLK